MGERLVIIGRILYFYLPPNYCTSKCKFKRAAGHTRASLALPRGLIIVVSFSTLKPHLAHSWWHLLVGF